MLSSVPSVPAPASPSVSTEEEKDAKKEKKRKREDAIDEIFETQTGNGNRKKKAAKDGIKAEVLAPTPVASSKEKSANPVQEDKSLASVLGAIREVPKGTALKEGKRHKKSKS